MTKDNISSMSRVQTRGHLRRNESVRARVTRNSVTLSAQQTQFVLNRAIQQQTVPRPRQIPGLASKLREGQANVSSRPPTPPPSTKSQLQRSLQNSVSMPVQQKTRTKGTAKAAWVPDSKHVTVISQELGLFEITVDYRGTSYTEVVLADNPESLRAFMDRISKAEGADLKSLRALESIIRAKLDPGLLPSPAEASQTLVDFVVNAPADSRELLKTAVEDSGLLKALVVANQQPNGQLESFFAKLKSKKCKDADLTPLKSAMKRIAKMTRSTTGAFASPLRGSRAMYTMTENGIVISTGENEGRLITNFTAEILEDIHESDGSEVKRLLKVRGGLNGEEVTFSVPAAEFSRMGWPMEHLGAGAVVYPGYSNDQHARAAIQLCSTSTVKRTIYVHTGWAQVAGEWVYLHAGGAIGANGPISGVEVDLRGELSRYCLPAPPGRDELRRCIRSTLDLRGLAPLSVTCCLEGATFRAPLGGECDTTVWLSGQTGNGKSELSARYQQHYGPKFDRKALPGSWSSTGNALEAAAHCAKEALFVVDDFCPRGSQYDVSRYHQTADRVIRALRNQSGRQRMWADGTLRPTKAPRCVLMGTGEDVPDGHSLRASMMIVELGPNDLKFDQLDDFQRQGASGVFAMTMSGYIRWLATSRERLESELLEIFAQYRSRATGSGTHKRTPELVANLMTGAHFFLQFAMEAGAIDRSEHERLLAESWDAIGEAAQQQQEQLEDADCAARFLSLIRSAICKGSAHLKTFSEGPPTPLALAQALGWTRVPGGDSLRCNGVQIGWYQNDDAYLDLNAAYSVVQDFARGANGIAVGAKTLSKRLRDGGHLATADQARGRILVRRTINGIRRNDLLHLKLETLLGDKPAGLLSETPSRNARFCS